MKPLHLHIVKSPLSKARATIMSPDFLPPSPARPRPNPLPALKALETQLSAYAARHGLNTPAGEALKLGREAIWALEHVQSVPVGETKP